MIIVMSVALIYDQDDNRDAAHEEGKMINMQILCVFTILLKLPSSWTALLGKYTQAKQQHDDGDNLSMTSCYRYHCSVFTLVMTKRKD